MKVDIHRSWQPYLQQEFDKAYFNDLTAFVKTQYQQFTCYPPGKAIFNAFNYCPFEDVKVVIIGQDPYHGIGQANGLCFSVANGLVPPPSLKNIFKEIEADLRKSYSKSGNLEHWAKQGVLLLNATLTVRAHQAGSHQNKGWEQFTDSVINCISKYKKNVVFLLWGGFAKKKVNLIDTTKHYILQCGHPSPLSANRGFWFGNKHFSKTNSLLETNGLATVDW